MSLGYFFQPRLRELRLLCETPEPAWPLVYVCRACGIAFRASEAHDFTRCAAVAALTRKAAA